MVNARESRVEHAVGLMPSTPGGLVAVQLEHDAKRHDFSLAGGELRQCFVERGGEAVAEHRILRLSSRRGVGLLALPAPLLGTEVVERGTPGKLAEPCLGAAAFWVEPVPAVQSPLEGRVSQVFCHVAISRQVEHVSVHVVEVCLGHGGEAPLFAETSFACW